MYIVAASTASGYGRRKSETSDYDWTQRHHWGKMYNVITIVLDRLVDQIEKKKSFRFLLSIDPFTPLGMLLCYGKNPIVGQSYDAFCASPNR